MEFEFDNDFSSRSIAARVESIKLQQYNMSLVYY